MRRIQLVIIFSISTVAGALTAEPQPVIPSLSNEQVSQLNEGEVLVEMATHEELGIGDTIAVIDDSPDRVMAVIDMLDSEWIEIIGLEGEREIVRGMTPTPWPMEDRVWTVTALSTWREVDGVQVIVSDWEYVPGSGNLDHTEGYWLLMPWGENGEQTLLRHYAVVGIGTPVPTFIINWAMENRLPDTIEDIRDALRRQDVDATRLARYARP